MLKVLFLLPYVILFSGIYNYSITDIDGDNISVSQFAGKKILFVNTASNSQYTSQYGSLEKLYQKYKDSLVIIAIPSNSFGDEASTNDQIKQFVATTYKIHFLLTQKTTVEGTNQSSLYAWLTKKTQNGIMDNDVNNDFYKFLVDGSGNLIGAFAPSVDPMSNEIQSAVQIHN